MKRYSLLATLLCALWISPAFSQSKSEAAVAAAVENLKKAMVDGDRASLESIAAESLSYGHSSGKVEDKKSFVDAIASGASNFTSIDLTDQTITVTGKTAIVRHQLFARTEDAGKAPGTVTLKILLVWQKQGKEWKLLARQAVRVP